MTYLHNRSCTPDAVGERYWNESSAPLYPFGHGLTYGHAVYHDLSISKPTIKLGETAVVSVAVTNTGDHASDEVVQMYCHQRYGASSRPIRELKGFRRVYLDIGETKTVTFPLGSEQLRYWSAAKRDWVQDATEIDIWLGGSSTADLAATLQVTDAADPRATQIASTTEKADAL